MATWREEYPLEKTKPLKKTIESLFAYILIFLFFYAIVYMAFMNSSISADSSNLKLFSLNSPWLLIAIFAVMVLKYIYEVFYMKYYFYDLEGKTLAIKKGVFSKNEISLPVNRIQDVYVDQDILDRIFGLYDVHVSSATNDSAFLSHIDGINKINSEKLKGLLLQAVHK